MLTPHRIKTREIKQARNRDRLLAAARALFDTAGYHQTGLRDIALNAGLTTGALFASFPQGKDELYSEIYGHPPVTPEQGRELRALVERLEEQLNQTVKTGLQTTEAA